MKLFRLVLLLFVVSALAVILNRLLVPNHNTAATRFDTLIVLGYPANPDGTPSPEQLERVLETVREYKAGVASEIIMTGGAAHNQFIEAHVMAQLAESKGVPATSIVEEGQAQNTIQNIYYSSQIMHTRNWSYAEIISSPAHLGRTAMILQALGKSHSSPSIQWHTHASQWPAEYGPMHRAFLNTLEASRCLQIRIFGFPSSQFLP